MFDQYVFTENSCRNFAENGSPAGFELETMITYYRGVPLSMVYDLGVTVNGLPVPEGDIRISLDKSLWFTLKEAETVAGIKWEYGEPLYIRCYVEGGLRKGDQEVTLSLSVFPAYYPMPAGGRRTRLVTII